MDEIFEIKMNSFIIIVTTDDNEDASALRMDISIHQDNNNSLKLSLNTQSNMKQIVTNMIIERQRYIKNNEEGLEKGDKEEDRDSEIKEKEENNKKKKELERVGSPVIGGGSIIRLCSFNANKKMEPLSFATWMNILNTNPKTVLILLSMSKKCNI